MGNSQSTKRPTVHSFFPSSSDYTRLPSSPSKQPLLKEESHLESNYSEQYETTSKDSLKMNTDNAKKITQLERKFEYLEKLIASKNAALEVSITKNTVTDKKVIELDMKVENLKHLLSVKKTNERNIAYEKKVTEHEKKIESLERQLIAMNAVREASTINLMDADVDGLAVVALNHQNSEHEMERDKDMDEPEYANRLEGLMLMLVFLVFILIGMQL
ncbi:hypothetical protein FRX31_017314 [Thalictrum thalictroides]|uniref:Uncharacterized protein n=1 Tax=Thalictrum thalictroides TaxID=46969 RepID=A0A7J6W784_THATH|nr:hypothetical protein FRX31_017314 [Thalictrum thalictroides]